ncbi:MAG: hypothetical protein IJH32_05830, partial [Ruminococcus sp.]|nr:hypothetical protein [Ruminococcus sp.]
MPPIAGEVLPSEPPPVPEVLFLLYKKLLTKENRKEKSLQNKQAQGRKGRRSKNVKAFYTDIIVKQVII